jgi:hypothetical protein
MTNKQIILNKCVAYPSLPFSCHVLNLESNPYGVHVYTKHARISLFEYSNAGVAVVSIIDHTKKLSNANDEALYSKSLSLYSENAWSIHEANSSENYAIISYSKRHTIYETSVIVEPAHTFCIAFYGNSLECKIAYKLKIESSVFNWMLKVKYGLPTLAIMDSFKHVMRTTTHRLVCL